MKKKNIFTGYRLIRIVAIAVFVTIAGIISVKAHMGIPADTSGEVISLDVSDNDNVTQVSERTIESSREAASCFVYICGEVIDPGVYECSAGTRLGTVVDMAGGTTPDADITSVNLAREVSDGEQVIILKKGSGTAATTGGAQGTDTPAAMSGASVLPGLVNINTADENELKTLPGIGDAKAKAIVTYRNTNGSFKTKEDVMNISGIKNAAFDKIKDLITV